MSDVNNTPSAACDTTMIDPRLVEALLERIKAELPVMQVQLVFNIMGGHNVIATNASEVTQSFLGEKAPEKGI